ncbi:Fc receptor-like A precursor [Rattus norvegicus]|uniref:Fc receptor-like A n=2 Tax=Rattus norvegicus TaxID=10116 RepID=FCRLA_RAT|nr:Fc receptor-like A precursor [Rattus norvegicus]Q3B8P2.2 RecName: Full=Fc receptor-like A; AltName: Full=Fc receptor-like and mucin-like protein 1; Flags: Precursor [Rattus norvegicus]AAI58821.1 Fcrla protein [Rattus norvegicus]|eukprot:NP_001094152.1 Fc receptor-like A precursor [Rattus norvegicus]
MKLSCMLIEWALYVCPAVLLATQMSLAASLETLKCEGPVSTEHSSCLAATEEDEGDDDMARSGEADFRFKGYTFSKPFHLIVSYDWLILQGPATSIFEGDTLVLHCRAWQDWPLTQVIFYREGSALGPPGSKSEFSIAVARKSDSGHYHCSGIFRSPGPGSQETASPVAITVQELFAAPVLKALPSSGPQEGGSVTLSCETKLSLQRSASRLLFSFYKDGRSLSSRGISSEFRIPEASEEHSGSYWCEAATEDRQISKQSPELEIRVQALQKPATPETPPPAKAPGPLPLLPTPSDEQPVFSFSDPYLTYRINRLLRQMQDVRILLGHLVMELRNLSAHRKPATTKS